MHFVHRQKGERPENGYALIFGLHGGGGVPKETNDQQFTNHKNLYGKYLEDGTIWVAPRSVQDLPDMWRRPYMQDFLYGLTDAFTSLGLADPNRVFLTGYSAGGDGVYHMAPRMADNFAGAMMCAGHPNDVDLINIRNLPFSIQVGGKDTAYNRNVLAQKYIDKLEDLSQEYGGFEQNSKVQPDKPHWMNFEQRQVFPWLFSKVREPYPDLVLFRQHPDRQKKVMYYVRVDDRGQNQLVEVERNGNRFDVRGDFPVKVRVNRNFVDFDQPVQIWHNQKQTYKAMAKVRGDVMQRTFQERFDPYFIFDDEFQSVPNAQLNQGRSQQEMSMQAEQYSAQNFYAGSGGAQRSNNLNVGNMGSKIYTNFESNQKSVGCGDLLGGIAKSQIPKMRQRKLEGNVANEKQECEIF